jgi:hypothetical protein
MLAASIFNLHKTTRVGWDNLESHPANYEMHNSASYGIISGHFINVA